MWKKPSSEVAILEISRPIAEMGYFTNSPFGFFSQFPNLFLNFDFPVLTFLVLLGVCSLAALMVCVYALCSCSFEPTRQNPSAIA